MKSASWVALLRAAVAAASRLPHPPVTCYFPNCKALQHATNVAYSPAAPPAPKLTRLSLSPALSRQLQDAAAGDWGVQLGRDADCAGGRRSEHRGFGLVGTGQWVHETTQRGGRATLQYETMHAGCAGRRRRAALRGATVVGRQGRRSSRWSHADVVGGCIPPASPVAVSVLCFASTSPGLRPCAPMICPCVAAGDAMDDASFAHTAARLSPALRVPRDRDCSLDLAPCI